ncbi:uncharacterized protein LOC124438643 [Xenia sp. Carnegie-2017]|uniref:uncharacterized protein LOC124438643 n=1 Tax=Xenia sp. Carnegie-2017 TaxID=2897299 RepID=UPI001F038646|nr:uncharacterized protein LOC124438643 [Xenia sp. Carnegie-2017]
MHGKADKGIPASKLIQLAFGVSKSTYLPFKGARYIKNGHIIGLKERSGGYRESNEQSVCSIGGWEGSSYEKKETEILVFKHADQKLAVFGFRGTDSSKDWLKNLNIKLSKVRIGRKLLKVFGGIRNRYFDISSWFEREYQAIPQDYTILITGHSLGGALATLASAFAAGKLHRKPNAVITFASPMIGNEEFRQYYVNMVGCKDTLRIANEGDVVTKLPPGKNYVHVCSALKVSGRKRRFGISNISRSHGLYDGYAKGLSKKFSNKNAINFGCDQRL